MTSSSSKAKGANPPGVGTAGSLRTNGKSAPQPNSLPAEPARFDEATAAETSGPAPNIGGRIGGSAPPETLFDRFREKALEADRARFASLEGTSLVGIEGNLIRIGAPSAFQTERLRQRVTDLEALATNLFGQATKISVEVSTARSAREESHETREASRKRRQEALNSECVNMAIEVLEAEIVEIRSLGGGAR